MSTIEIILEPIAPIDIDVSTDGVIDIDVSTPAPPGPTGPQGPPGPRGPSGGENSTYSHHQASAAAQWNITHGLGFPVEPVILLDDDPQTPIWTDVEHIDNNSLILVFPSPVTGWAHFF